MGRMLVKSGTLKRHSNFSYTAFKSCLLPTRGGRRGGGGAPKEHGQLAMGNVEVFLMFHFSAIVPAGDGSN